MTPLDACLLPKVRRLKNTRTARTAFPVVHLIKKQAVKADDNADVGICSSNRCAGGSQPDEQQMWMEIQETTDIGIMKKKTRTNLPQSSCIPICQKCNCNT